LKTKQTPLKPPLIRGTKKIPFIGNRRKLLFIKKFKTMLDIKFIRENADKVKLAAKQKNIKVDID